MQRQLTAFVEQPSKKTYLAVRAAVLRESPLPIAATQLASLERLLDEGAATEVLDRIDALPLPKVLSPRVHLLAAEAADVLQDAQRGELERMLFVITLRGLLATGEGTPAEPYIVCQASDEHDIAEALGLEPAGQSLVEHAGKLCDVLICTDGRELWFDLAGSVSRPPAIRKTAHRKNAHRKTAKSCSRQERRRAVTAGRSRP